MAGGPHTQGFPIGRILVFAGMGHTDGVFTGRHSGGEGTQAQTHPMKNPVSRDAAKGRVLRNKTVRAHGRGNSEETPRALPLPRGLSTETYHCTALPLRSPILHRGGRTGAAMQWYVLVDRPLGNGKGSEKPRFCLIVYSCCYFIY